LGHKREPIKMEWPIKTKPEEAPAVEEEIKNTPVTDETPTLLPCLVADSAAFLRNVSLDKLASKIVTIQDVISEIRDPMTRQRLQVLPYDIHMREPSLESVKFVTEFAKKTGDFKVLSAVDLRVLALTYQLDKQYSGGSHIKSEPTGKTEVVPRSKAPSANQMAGFYIAGKKKSQIGNKDKQTFEIEENGKDDPMIENDMNVDNLPTEPDMTSAEDEMIADADKKEDKNDSRDSGMMEGDAGEDIANDVNEDGVNEVNLNKDDVNENDEDDDEAGWITPHNIQEVKQQMGDDGMDQEMDLSTVKCGCLTTDFAMQNVLIQMGLHVVSVDGRLIKQARNYVQKCTGCNKETSNMETSFCPHCGNKTLVRVAVSIAADGTKQYHYPKRRRNFNIRGTKFSLPKPEGGRRGDDIILCEDQKMRYKNMPKQRDIVNALDPEYIARDSPFARTDTTSKAFNLGHHLNRDRARNPNASKKLGRKKK